MIQFKQYSETMIELVAERFHGELFNLCIQCPDRKRFKNGRFVFLNSHSNIEYFLENFQDAEWSDDLNLTISEYHKFKSQESKLIEAKKGSVESDFEFKTKPFDHQLKAFEISKELDSYGLFFEQGCGKTKVVIDNAAYLYHHNKIDSLVIIAPNGVHRNWLTDEFPVHCNCKYEGKAWSTTFIKKHQLDWEYLKKCNKSNSQRLAVYSFNIETFVSKKSQEELIDILNTHNTMIVIDESQKIKNPSAKRTKFLTKIASLAKYRRILTGTPIANGAQGFYSQFQFLDPKIIGISSYYAFKAKYCIMGGWEQKQIIAYKNIHELQNKVDAHSMRVLKKDCLDLPEKLYQESMFTMTKEQLKLYDEVKKQGLAELSNQTMILDSVMAKMTKMRQISSGFIKDTDTGKCFDIVPKDKNPRLLKLLDLLEQIDGKVIIWTTQIYDADIIMNALKKEAVRYDGQITNEEKELNRHKFKKDPNIKYFVANLQMPEGLTLTEAKTTIYYTNTYDLEKREQSEDRNHRIGTTTNINYIDICCTNTIDRKIVQILRKKKKVSEFILKDPTSFFLEY